MIDVQNYVGGAVIAMFFAVVQSLVIAGINRRRDEQQQRLGEIKAALEKFAGETRSSIVRINERIDRLEDGVAAKVSVDEFAQTLGGWRAETAHIRDRLHSEVVSIYKMIGEQK
jgi:Cu/Ag efflux pump CusA